LNIVDRHLREYNILQKKKIVSKIITEISFNYRLTPHGIAVFLGIGLGNIGSLLAGKINDEQFLDQFIEKAKEKGVI
jgi:hypothetical protein